MFNFLSWFSVDTVIGVGIGLAIWAAGDFISRWYHGKLTIAGAASALGVDVKNVEAKVVQALALGAKDAITTVRHEAAVKLSAVEAALHSRLVGVEKSVFGANYSADTIALAAQAAAKTAADVATKAVNAAAAPAADPAPLPSTPASASALASTALAGLASLGK